MLVIDHRLPRTTAYLQQGFLPFLTVTDKTLNLTCVRRIHLGQYCNYRRLCQRCTVRCVLQAACPPTIQFTFGILITCVFPNGDIDNCRAHVPHFAKMSRLRHATLIAPAAYH